jgi:hypothetical protein
MGPAKAQRKTSVHSPCISTLLLHAQVVECGGTKKDADWIFSTHVALAEEIAPSQPGGADNLLGVVMDNTKANRSALKKLKDKFPRWLTLGCNAHALNLIFKDLANESRCEGTARVVTALNKMSNAINNSERIKSLLNQHQVEVATIGKPLAIAAPCPTRFSTNYLVAITLLRSKTAIINMVNSEEWEAASASSTNAGTDIRDVTNGMC